MTANRRSVTLGGLSAIAALAVAPAAEESKMFGMIGKMTVADGKRDAVIALLLDNAAAMPGCLSYIVATDSTDANAIWITEAWDSKESHAASLKLPQVQTTIAKARAFITGMTPTAITTPVGGYGLVAAKG
ncbi:MAG TPA: putative quinol monooxygenase [Rhizomicrobium sp.]|jgi:quinol monooxygenase YgiN